MVTCEHCGMTFINKACVTKHIRNGKCPKYVPPKTYKELQAENARLKIEKYMLIVPSYMRGMLERGEISQKDLDKWYKQALERKP